MTEPYDGANSNSSPLESPLLAALKTSWWLVLACMIAMATIAFGWSLTQPKVYAADSSAMLRAVTGDAGNIGSVSVGESLARNRVKTYVTMATSRPVAEQVIADLGLNTTPEVLVRQVSVSVPVDTTVLKITATDGDPRVAQQLADTWVDALRDQAAIFETGDADGEPLINVVPVNSAILPSTPISPNIKRNVALGGLLGALAGTGLALLRHRSDRRIRSVETVERTFNLSVIGTVPTEPRLVKGDHLASFITSGSRKGDDHRFTESIREVRTNLQFMNVDDPPRVVVITSAMAGNGKSTLTAALAIALAESGQSVTVVDGDLRRPRLSEVLGMVPTAGVTDILVGRASIYDVLQQWGGHPLLHVLGAGSTPPNPSELLGSRRMKDLLHELSRTSLVLVDAPPLLPVTDAAILAANADGAIVVATARETTIDELEKSLSNLTKVGAKPLGVVLNKVPRSGGEAYGYYGSDYYAASKPAITPEPGNPVSPRPAPQQQPAPQPQPAPQSAPPAVNQPAPPPASTQPPARRSIQAAPAATQNSGAAWPPPVTNPAGQQAPQAWPGPTISQTERQQ